MKSFINRLLGARINEPRRAGRDELVSGPDRLAPDGVVTLAAGRRGVRGSASCLGTGALLAFRVWTRNMMASGQFIDAGCDLSANPRSRRGRTDVAEGGAELVTKIHAATRTIAISQARPHSTTKDRRTFRIESSLAAST